MSYIEFKNVKKSFEDTEVLKGISLSIEKGEFISLLGPSGCGKSTLLRCLSGLEEVTEGSFILDGKDITKDAPQKRNIGTCLSIKYILSSSAISLGSALPFLKSVPLGITKISPL